MYVGHEVMRTHLDLLNVCVFDGPGLGKCPLHTVKPVLLHLSADHRISIRGWGQHALSLHHQVWVKRTFSTPSPPLTSPREVTTFSWWGRVCGIARPGEEEGEEEKEGGGRGRKGGGGVGGGAVAAAAARRTLSMLPGRGGRSAEWAD